MIVELGGVRFSIAGALTEGERLLLEQFQPSTSPGARPIAIQLVEEESTAPATFGDAALTYDEGELHLEHLDFDARYDPSRHVATLIRSSRGSYPLHVTLRALLSFEVARSGGIPLHSAAVQFGEGAVLFHGRSGDGKSSIARRLGLPVFTDELTVIRETSDGFIAHGSGFWGSLEAERRSNDRGAHPIVALITLRKGGPLQLVETPAKNVIRSVLPSLLVPPTAPLWNEAISALQKLIRSVPSFELSWSLEDDPLPLLRHQFEQ